MSIKINLQLTGEITLPDPFVVSLKDMPPIDLKPELLATLLKDMQITLSAATISELQKLLFTDAYWAKLVESLQAGVVITVPTPTPPVPTPTPIPLPPSNNSSLLKPGYGPPSLDSKIIYVSSSTGDDVNDGLSEAKPKKTIAAGYSLLRTDFPDHLLLKKGDVWVDTFGTWKKCGRSLQEPMVVGSYGTGPRPLLKTGGNNGLITQNSSGTPLVMHSVTISGLSFYAHTRDPQGTEFVSSQTSPVGVKLLRGGHHMILDDCLFRSYHNAIVIQDYENTGMQDMTVRGCVAVDSYSDNQGHSQGIYCSGVDRLLIEDCVFDHNGWNTAFPGAIATMYNHNMYLQYNCKNVTTRRNILMRASSHAIQQRSGGIMENTFAWRNPIGLTMGSNQNPVPNLGTVTGSIKNSVILEGNDITPALPRGWGVHFEPTDIAAITVENNVIANVVATGTNRLSIFDKPAGTYVNNIVWNWPSVWGGVNTKFDSPGPFKDPTRSIVGYKGLTEPQVIDKIRSQSRDTFDPAFTAEVINTYIRAGFVAP
jgi:hypothetical protein